MSMQVTGRGRALADINVTPMADIMIVLLIIFMVMTPLIGSGHVRQLPPAAHSRDTKGNRRLAVREQSALADINVTPLIDVMLVLLIIFMVVSPMTTRGLDVGLPDKQPGTIRPDPPVPLILVLEADGMSLNRSPILDPAALGSRLQERFASRMDRTLFVKADGVVPYGRVVEAMDVARGAGAERIGIVTD